MPATTLSCVPPRFEAGNTVIWTQQFSCYPASEWTLQFVLSQLGAVKLSAAGVADDDSFTITLTAASTATLEGGAYNWAEYVTNEGVRETARTGSVIVLPNLAIEAAPTFAEKQVTLLEGAMERLASGTNETVNINGQSFTKRNIETYQKQLTYWQARVIREQRYQAALRGDCVGGRIGIQFVPRGSNGNFGPRLR